ncbi:Glutathione S-transferase [Operophtera brumata]|uniref:Glutathione S-transferase n=1 Tax=Operophtera brumata TaxID=104452 RepID=A0A0L7LTB4_OPEBR|nr:Glutathione S-transferase [Operophtera brumata]
MSEDYTLYGDMASPPVRFVLVTATLLGTKLKFQNIDLFKSENKTDWYRKINPLQKVPALVVGDEVISDSHAVALYLCQRKENQDLYPKDDILLKARIDEMLFYNATTLFPVDSAIYTDLFAGKWPASDTNLANWYACLAYLEHRLSRLEWLSGDKMLLGDICCAMTVSSLSIIVPIPDKYERVQNWMQRLEKLPSFKINKEGLDRLHFYVKSIGPKSHDI